MSTRAWRTAAALAAGLALGGCGGGEQEQQQQQCVGRDNRRDDDQRPRDAVAVQHRSGLSHGTRPRRDACPRISPDESG